MNTETRSSLPERRLLQIGVALFLFSSLWGFAIPFLASARIGLSVHTLSGFQGLLFIALGLMWPHLVLGRQLLGWGPAGYARAVRRPRGIETTLVTPPSLVALLASGWESALPLIHPSARSA